MKTAKIAWTLAYLLLSKGAIASPHTWSGATSTDWTAGTNWDISLNPSGEVGQLTFPQGATRFTSTYTGNPSDLFISSLIISTVGDGSGSNFYTIGGANSSSPIEMGGNATITINQPSLSDGYGPRLAYLDIQSPTTITTNMTLSGVDPITQIDRNTVLNNLMGSQALTLTGNPNGGFTLDSNTTFTGSITIGDSLNPTTSSVIAGANCFGSGTVTLQNGSLIVPYNAALTTIPNDFTIEGNSTISLRGQTAFSGTLSGTQNLTKTGPGTLFLTNDNSGFSGDIYLNQGILSFYDTKSLGTGTLNLNDGTTLTFYGQDNFFTPTSLATTGSATINANGPNNLFLIDTSLTVDGTGVLTVSDMETYLEQTTTTITSNGPTVNLGKLTGLSAGQSLTLAGSGSISFSEICVDNMYGNEVSFTISGPLVVDLSSGFQKTGTGKLFIDGIVAPDAAETTVAEGSLIFTKNINGSVTVSNDTILTGSGTSTISGNLLIDGGGTLILGPFYNNESLTIGNTYILKEGATQVNTIVNPRIYSNASTTLLSVKENVTISANTNCIIIPQPSPDGYLDGTTFEIINTNGKIVTGTFQNLVLMPPLLYGYLDYSNESVVSYIMSIMPIASSAMTGNAASVANTLNRIGYTADTSVDGVIRSILALSSDAEKYDALNQLHPALYKGAALVQENNAVQVRNAISQRLQVIVDNQSCSNPVKNKSCKTSGDASQFWLSGIGDFLKQESTFYANNPSIGYRANSVGVVTGLDHQFASFFYLGAMGGYTHSNVKSQNNKGRAKIDSGYGGLYFSAIGKLFYGNLSLIGAWNGFDKQRNIIFPNINLTANSSHVGQQLTSHLDSGLYLSVGKGITLRPFDSFDWIVQKENAYIETNAGEYNLAVSKSHANMLRNELGMSWAACRDLRGTRVSRVSLDTKIGWVREVRMEGKNSEAEFVSTDIPAPFTVAGYFPNRNLFSCGASVTAVAMHDRLTCTLHYSGVFGAKYSDNGMSGQLCLTF